MDGLHLGVKTVGCKSHGCISGIDGVVDILCENFLQVLIAL